MATGFLKSKNLSESTQPELDEAALNNLYGQNISQDIELFSNNLKNKSILFTSDFEVQNNYFVVTNSDKVAFSNRTQIFTGSNNEISLEVRDSNGKNRFKLYYSNNEIYTDSSYNLARNDFILFENFENFKKERFWTDRQSLSSESVRVNFDTIVNEDRESFGRSAFSYYLDVDDDDGGDEENVHERIDIIAFQQSQVDYKRIITPLLNEDFSTNKILNISGYFTITNDESILTSNPAAPGIYITNGTIEARAFSNYFNSWQENSGTIETESSLTAVKELILTNPEITYTANLNSETSSSALSDFTHRVDVKIDGVTYALLCKKL